MHQHALHIYIVVRGSEEHVICSQAPKHSKKKTKLETANTCASFLFEDNVLPLLLPVRFPLQRKELQKGQEKSGEREREKKNTEENGGRGRRRCSVVGRTCAPTRWNHIYIYIYIYIFMDESERRTEAHTSIKTPAK
jgi:hypothetical protein